MGPAVSLENEGRRAGPFPSVRVREVAGCLPQLEFVTRAIAPRAAGTGPARTGRGPPSYELTSRGVEFLSQGGRRQEEQKKAYEAAIVTAAVMNPTWRRRRALKRGFRLVEASSTWPPAP